MAWNSDDWQEYCMLLASRYHLGAFQEIFDSHGGDGGIEGFAKDGSGAGYQCYVPEDNALTPLTGRIIGKINADTFKLKKNQQFFAKCLLPHKLKRLTFLIPREYLRDKEIAAHSGKRETEVVSWNLEFVDPNFRIIVGHGAEFDETLKAVKALGRARIDIGDVVASDADKQAWETANLGRVAVLDDKLGRTMRPEAAIRDMREELIECAVIAQNSVERIRKEDPDGWLALIEAKHRKGRALKGESARNRAFPTDFMQRVSDEYRTQIQHVMPAASDETARILADEAIVEWLLTCPLNFYIQDKDEAKRP